MPTSVDDSPASMPADPRMMELRRWSARRGAYMRYLKQLDWSTARIKDFMLAREGTVTEAIDGTNAMKDQDDDYLPPEKWFLTAADNFKKTRKLEKRLRKEKRRLEQDTEQNTKVEINELRKDTKTHELRTPKKTSPIPALRRSLRIKSTSGKDDVASQSIKTEASQKNSKRKRNAAQEEVVTPSVKKVKLA
ncbi:hypothetical protein H0H92_008088 [Tricholoma furcatifolium]|nr:hypothetical protein H0H92_008088 [Tricholoma furcatifolium]